MMTWFKKQFYFLVASYFRFFAKKRLKKWQPQIVVVTGSTGKTTAFSLIEAQLGTAAIYSHHANSAFGVPLHILGFEGGESFNWRRWLQWFWRAPGRVNRALPDQKIYVVECDCDRPGEGEFLAALLQPEIVIWLNTIATHAMNFDYLVAQKKFARPEDAIAVEFGHIAASARQFIIANADSGLINEQLAKSKTNAKILAWKEADFLKNYELTKAGTSFTFIHDRKITVPALLPKAAWLAVAAAEKLTAIYNLPFDHAFAKIILPPGRSSVFSGIRDTTIIDSTYNSSPLAVREMLGMFAHLHAKKKWLLVGDMLELGQVEAHEHEQLAALIRATPGLERVILLGKRVKKYTAPLLADYQVPVATFENAPDLYRYLLQHLSGGEVLLFKGAQAGMWEAVVEMLLANPAQDVPKLARRSPSWEKRRQALGLQAIRGTNKDHRDL